MKLFIKGVIIGIGKILPGISGGLLAIMLNVYDEALDKLVHLFNKDNIKYLFILGSGILLSILFGSSLILTLLNKYYLMIMLLFIGLIIGGSLELKNKVNKINIIFLIIGIGILFVVYLFKNNSSTITPLGLFLVGIVEAGTIIVPGVSGTAILMILGYYYEIMSLISELTIIGNIVNNIISLFPFIIGLLLGMLLFIKIMYYLTNKHHDSLYSFIMGVSFSSIILLFMETFKYHYCLHEIVIGLILLILGYKISKKFI